MRTGTVNPNNNADDKELVDSILAKGIIQNLIVYSETELFEVPAGRRRFSSLAYLHKKGRIPDDYPVPCLVKSKEEATDLSLIENLKRKAPHAADIFTAFNELTKQRQSVGQIAATHGITEAAVNQYLRLGRVHKTLFKLFRKDALSLDQMMAFASSADTKLQIATYKALGNDCNTSARRIREELQSGRKSSDTALARFVGLEEYEKAGGATEADLFSNLTMLCDLSLLVSLAEAKLAKTVESIDGWKWVVSSLDGVSGEHAYARMPTVQLPVPKELTEKETELDSKLDEIQQLANDGEWTGELEKQYDLIDEQLTALRDKIDIEYTGYNEDDLPYAGCIVSFNQLTGEQEVHKGYLTKVDLKAFQAKAMPSGKPSSDEKNTDTESVAKKPTISAKLSSDLGQYRRAIVKAELSSAHKLTHDLLHYQLCVSVLGKGMTRYSRVLSLSLSEVSNETSIDDFSSTKAAKVLSATLNKLDTGWLSLKSEVKRFESFRALSSAKKQAMVSYCVAQQLESGSVTTGKDKLIDLLVTELDTDFTTYWRPNKLNFFGRLTTPALLALGRKWNGATWAKTYANKPKKSMVELFQIMFHGESESLTEKQQTIRKQWIPTEISK